VTRTPVSFRLDILVMKLAAQLRPVQGATLTVSAREATVLAEPRHVRRIVMNLLSNALRQVEPHRGRVEVTLAVDDTARTAEVVVTDDGPGVAEELAPRLFERFATMAPGGAVVSGVGLPLARELAELNGGSLTLRSAAPAAFGLRLPLSEALPEALAPASALRHGDGARPAARARHAAVRAGASLLAVQLAPELDVTIAASLAAARSELARGDVDVVMSDLGLPDGSGLELLGDLDGNADRRPAFIVLSAFGGPEVRASAIAAGADDYVVKPYAIDELRARIERVLREARERELALERQRDEVLGEIHDGVGGALARALAMLRGAGDHEDAQRSSALGELETATSELRDGLRLLSQRECRWSAVAPDLRFALATLAEAHGLAFTSDVGASDVMLRPVVVHTLRPVATEALTNTIKHASASSLRFVLACNGEVVHLTVADDGRGFRDGAGAGLGIRVMKERAERVGGAFEVMSGPRGGVEVRTSIPIHAGRRSQRADT
jgi:signal transduction histidine kinase